MTRATTPRQGDVELAPSAVVRHLCHELRQPLSTIESSAYYLQMVLQAETRTEKELERIQEMVRQVDWILMDVVHYLQATTPRTQWVDIVEIVSSAVTASARYRPIDLEWADTMSSTLVLVDPGQAEHLVRTLLAMYRQVAGPERGIGLSLSRQGDKVQIEFRSEADEKVLQSAEDLMTPFTPHLPAGTGLALASARRIAEANGGTARVRVEKNELIVEVRLPAQ